MNRAAGLSRARVSGRMYFFWSVCQWAIWEGDPVLSELKGRGVAWTEERGTSDEGPPPEAARRARRRLKSAPEANASQQ